MDRIINHLKNIFFKKKILDEAEAEELRNDFKARYHHFKRLLSANNKALDVMAEMEETLRGNRPFGMSHVRSMCTTISTNVWQIVQHLNELAPGKYETLYDRFKEIQKQINPYLKGKTLPKEGPLVLPLSDVDKDQADQVGKPVKQSVHSDNGGLCCFLLCIKNTGIIPDPAPIILV